jgi:hypothetical protein
MAKNWLKEHKIATAGLFILIFCLVAGIFLTFVGSKILMLCSVFLDTSFFRWLAIVFLSCLLMYSIWSKKKISRTVFLCLLISLSIYIISSFVNFKTLGDLLTFEDHPRYYSTSVETKDLLLTYGSPFGFNHNFQGGIPTFFYIRSSFLELIPFSLLFGNQLGYQIMTIFFILLIPLSVFFLTLELAKNELLARLVSFIAVFQLQAWPFLYAGMISTLVALPLSFLCVLFFLRYLYDKRFSLFPLVFFCSLVLYTHLVVFAITSLFLAMVFLYKIVTERQFRLDFKKLLLFGSLHLFVCLPFYYNFLNYASFLRITAKYISPKPLLQQIFSMVSYLIGSMKIGDPLFFSIIFLLCFYPTVKNSSQRLILRNSIIFSTAIFIFSLFGQVPQAVLLNLRLGLYHPYIAIFNALLLITLLPISKGGKIFGSLIVLFIVIHPPHENYVETVHTPSEIDKKIKDYVSLGDYVLFENCAQFNPTKSGEDRFEYCDRDKYAHWLTYLQKDLGFKFFSQIGDDAHPFNNLRDMYIVCGLYKGEPLGEDNEEEFVGQLKDWGVNKVCIWSDTAEKFFSGSKYFKLLGKSEKYTCFRANYQILPEVRLSRGGRASLVEETPFSFSVILKDVPEKETAIINKNYFNFWSAADEKGEKVSLRACNRKICFTAAGSGRINFKYRKNIILNLISLFFLGFTLVADSIKAAKNKNPKRPG